MDAPPAPPPSPPPRQPRQPRRCNADYRWTVPKVTAFLEALARCGRVAEAARAVGMSRQAAYKLRARLDGARFRAAFEGARKAGIRARAAASRARVRSPWDGPGLAALDHWRAAPGGTSAAQGDGPPPRGDARSARGDRPAPQGYPAPAQGEAAPAQADAIRRKATEHRLDSGPGVPRPGGAAG